MHVGYIWIVIGVLTAGLSAFSLWYGPHLLNKSSQAKRQEAQKANVFSNNKIQAGRDVNVNQTVVNVDPSILIDKKKAVFQNGKIVGEVDRVYDSKDGARFVIKEILLRSDIDTSNPIIVLNGVSYRIIRVQTAAGIIASPAGARGPVWRDVEVEQIL